ncbi:MAG: hypothetical protein AUG00_05205 [Candidatus Rokubacteria bacterium 13_1_20CM_2_70_7]|nr:MAG: hypothetical protein AUG00_05205 [Candidatus Rokubacteria bacterium 13_1_20CM_2_70_7]
MLLLITPHVSGFSGGPLRNVTDLAPTCAACHSSFSKDQLRNEPEAFANSQVKENKHYKAIEDGVGPYQQMSPADRQKLLADVKLMDELASVNLSAPASLRPGQEAQITVTVKGGQGVVGVFLLDTDLRFQARPVQGDGWVIVGPPKAWGGDGQEQTKWVDSRAPGLKKNLNSVIIFDQKTDLAAKKLAEGKVVWTVKAPQEPGTYSITAVFHFGAEKASPVGTVTTPTGAVLPRGGPGGASARIMFAKPVTVTVR